MVKMQVLKLNLFSLMMFFTIRGDLVETINGNSTKNHLDYSNLYDFTLRNNTEEILQLKRSEAELLLRNILQLGWKNTTNLTLRLPKSSPPEFMLNLYRTVFLNNGRNEYKANIIRGFKEEGTEPFVFKFNINGFFNDERILDAELHLFRLMYDGVNNVTMEKSTHFIVRIYQLLENVTLKVPDLHKLSNVNFVSSFSYKWQVFRVREIIKSWNTGATNLGFLVTASTVFGDCLNITWSRKFNRNDELQPTLVVFTKKDESYDAIHKNIDQSYVSALKALKGENGHCMLRYLRFDFESIGWHNWIIHPKSILINQCFGSCSLEYLRKTNFTSNHALLINLLQQLNVNSYIEGSKCVPTDFKPLVLLYFDENENVILRVYENVIVEACGCS